VFGIVLAAVSVTLLGSVLPVVLLVVPALSATFLPRVHNEQVRLSH
jgi:ABC-type Mn2+/Zn2+ transport system permease subunit